MRHRLLSEPDGGGLDPGEKIGRYELLYPVARGGMATVWAARLHGTRGFQQIVALKILNPVLREDPDAQAMLLDEARIASRIHHPNVGQVLDFGEDDGISYIAMEWIDGLPLSKIAAAQRQRGRPLPLAWVLRVAAETCAGLHAAHELRDDDGKLVELVHRDVAPKNVMVTWSGLVKMVDFGVVRSHDRLHVTRVLGTIKGTTAYFSPEQIACGEIDRRSDLFAFGSMLFLLVTGTHPFRTDTAHDTVQSIISDAPKVPRDLVPGIDEGLERLLLKALEKAPSDRFQTAAELQRAIEGIITRLGMRTDEAEIGGTVAALFPGVEAERAARLRRAIAEVEARPGGIVIRRKRDPEPEADLVRPTVPVPAPPRQLSSLQPAPPRDESAPADAGAREPADDALPPRRPKNALALPAIGVSVGAVALIGLATLIAAHGDSDSAAPAASATATASDSPPAAAPEAPASSSAGAPVGPVPQVTPAPTPRRTPSSAPRTKPRRSP